MALGDADAAEPALAGAAGRSSPSGDCDSVIYALGTRPTRSSAGRRQGLALDKRGFIVADESTQATNLPGVFAGGGIVTGGATVILAMSAGRRAAKTIGAWLQQRSGR